MKVSSGSEARDMKRFLILATVAALCGAVPAGALAQTTSAPAMPGPTSLTIQLYSQNDSGETGSATFVQSGPDLLASVRVQNPVQDNQPIHIHKGTCANLTPQPTYPFPSLKNRRSQVKIKNLTIAQLLAAPYALNVHKGIGKDAAIYVSCGDIKRPA